MNYVAVDLASLAWLLPELCNTLALARQHLAQAKTDTDAKKSLTAAKKAVHDAQGALKVIDAQGLVHYLDCLDQAISGCAQANPHLENHAYQVLDEACYALVCYLNELYNHGEKLQPVALFAYYEALCLLDPSSDISKQYDPSDLYFPPLTARMVRTKRPATTTDSTSDLAQEPKDLKKIQLGYEKIMLPLLKGELSDRDCEQLSVLLNLLAEQSTAPHAYTFWKVCQGVVEGLNPKLLAQSTAIRRWLGRVNVQIKRLVSQSPLLSERLLREALYLIADRMRSLPQTISGDLHAQLAEVFSLKNSLVQNNGARRYGRAVPVNTDALLEKISLLKAVWDECLPAHVQADGMSSANSVLLRRLRSFEQQAAALRSALVEHGLSAHAAVVQEVALVSQTQISTATPLSHERGLVGANALLWVERSISPTGVPAETLLNQASDLITQLKSTTARGNTPASAAPTPVPDINPQTHLNAVVREAMLTLDTIEKQLDDFFRYGQDASVLSKTRPKLAQIASTLELIELRQISLAVRDVERIIAEFELNPHIKEVEGFEKLATLFSQVTQALDLYTLSPARALNDFVFNPYRHSLVDQRVTTAAVVENPFLQLEDSQTLAPLTTQPVALAIPVAAIKPSQISDHASPTQALATAQASAIDTGFELDESLLYAEQVFITSKDNAISPTLDAPTIIGTDDIFTFFTEEARQLLSDIDTQLVALEQHAQSMTVLSLIRRHFHTLKGSSRTLGLMYFGDAAWHVEQTINRVLVQQLPAGIDLIQFVRCAHERLSAWLKALDDEALAHDLNEPTVIRALDTQVALNHADFTAALAPYLTAVDRGLERQRLAQQEVSQAALFKPIRSPSTAITDHSSVINNPATILPLAAGLDVTFDDGLDIGLDFNTSLKPTVIAPKALAPSITKPAIRLVKDNSGSQPQDFIDRARSAVALAQSQSPAPTEIEQTPFVLTPVQVSPNVVKPVLDTLPSKPVLNDSIISFGPLRLPKALFAIYAQETRTHLEALRDNLDSWQQDNTLGVPRPCNYDAYRHVHSIKGSASTIGFNVFSELASPLEQLYHQALELRLLPLAEHWHGLDVILTTLETCFEQFCVQQYPAPQALCVLAIKQLSASMLAQCARAPIKAAALEPAVTPEPVVEPVEEPIVEPLLNIITPVEKAPADLLQVHTPRDLPSYLDRSVNSLQAAVQAPAHVGWQSEFNESVDSDDPAVVVDEIDWDIWSAFFVNEADTLLPKIQSLAVNFVRMPNASVELKRDLHTLKGSARMAGAMRLGSMVHDLETRLESNLVTDDTSLNLLKHAVDDIYDVFDALKAQSLRQSAPSPLQSLDTSSFTSMMANTSALFDDALAKKPSITSYVSPVSVVPPSSIEALPVLTAAPALPVLPVLPIISVAEPAVSPVSPIQPIVSPTSPTTLAAEEPQSFDVLDQRFVSHLNPASLRANVPQTPAANATVARTANANTALSSFTSPASSNANSNSSTAIALPDLRIQSQTLNQLVSQAAEISASKGRLDQHVSQLRQSLKDLTDNVSRLRQQLREVEIQAESQLAARAEHQQINRSDFDPLEFDRFTRLQELTRMLNESLSDMITLRDTVAKTLLETERELGLQSKASKSLSQSLMNSRLIAFDAVSDRLYRVVRQCAKELDKQINLDIIGGHLTLDRSILERLHGTLEHLVRNCVVHGIESTKTREKHNKSPLGLIRIQVSQQGNELDIVVQDDGQGLPLEQIRDAAIAKNLLPIQSLPTVQQLTEFIFLPGFSTAPKVTELAGRGIGMDVVRSDILSLGGRIHINTQAGNGTQFNIRIPVTLALNQVLMVKVQDTQHAIPASLVELVIPVKAAILAQAYSQGSVSFKGAYYPFTHLGDLLKTPYQINATKQSALVVLVRSGDELLALHVDAVLGSQEVVVKPLNTAVLGAAGLSSATLLADGALCLILDPLRMWFAQAQLQSRFSQPLSGSAQQTDARQLIQHPLAAPALDRSEHLLAQGRPSARQRNAQKAAQAIKLVAMVIDDSLTVRKVTQRLLEREGWEVLLAKDGMDALEQLQSARPDILLLDIEMPRMDGFDVARNVRADEKISHIPIIMITSRIGDKHRDHALSLGVNGYMGKPFRDDELLAMMAKLTAPQV